MQERIIKTIDLIKKLELIRQENEQMIIPTVLIADYVGMCPKLTFHMTDETNFNLLTFLSKNNDYQAITKILIEANDFTLTDTICYLLFNNKITKLKNHINIIYTKEEIESIKKRIILPQIIEEILDTEHANEHEMIDSIETLISLNLIDESTLCKEIKEFPASFYFSLIESGCFALVSYLKSLSKKYDNQKNLTLKK